MAEEGAKFTVEGIAHDLGGGRSVFVGQTPGDERVYIRFHNGEMETKVCLSFEAATALRELLGAVSSRGLMACNSWHLITQEQQNGSEESPISEPL